MASFASYQEELAAGEAAETAAKLAEEEKEIEEAWKELAKEVLSSSRVDPRTKGKSLETVRFVIPCAKRGICAPATRLCGKMNGECREGRYGLQPVHKTGEIMRPSGPEVLSICPGKKPTSGPKGHNDDNVDAGDKSPDYPETELSISCLPVRLVQRLPTIWKADPRRLLITAATS